MEFVRADVVARYHRLIGDEVFFNTGTDEHGSKLLNDAKAAGRDVKEYVDEYAARFRLLKDKLNLSVDNFIRTTDPHHEMAAQEFWRQCDKNGHIYKKNYEIKYCVGCELEKTESELDENGRCPIHPNKEIEIINEENYFFRFSAFQQKLLDFYEKNPDFVIPDFRFNEMKAFVGRGLQDFSISRLKSKMPWGIPVPGDESQVMYVWFDALVNYISAIGWPDDMETFNKWHVQSGGMVQYCGKDNNRQQSAMWQAMLMSVGLPPSKHIVINGFINTGGQKMSKSLGNVISPFDVVDLFKDVTDFPEDVLRFVVLHDVSSFEDGDVTMESIKNSYRANLQDGLGNLVSRIMKMSTSNSVSYVIEDKNEPFWTDENSFDMHDEMVTIWNRISSLDARIQHEEPFRVIKTNKDEGERVIKELIRELFRISGQLEPFLPNTAAEMQRLIKENKMPDKPLFARLER
jgi:methionyl-tRNA synthetase